MAAYFVTATPSEVLATRVDVAGALQPGPANSADVTLSLAGLPPAFYVLSTWAISQGTRQVPSPRSLLLAAFARLLLALLHFPLSLHALT